MHAKFFYIVVAALYYALLWPLGEAYSQSELRHFRVNGAVADGAVQPVAGAIALGEQNRFTDILDRGAKSVVSDATGRFSLELDVQVSPQALWLPIRVYKQGYAIAQRNFGVRGEQPDDVELSFELEPAHTRTVCLVDSHDKPIAGARLAAAATQAQDFWLDAQALDSLGIKVPSSDEAGLIELSWLSEHIQYDLRFEHPEPMPDVFRLQTLLQHATMLANTEPLTEQTFSGKSVLVCYGWWPLLIGQLELAHQLYYEHGLAIVCIVPQDTPTKDANWDAKLAAEPLPFPLAVDDGELAKLDGLSSPGSVALYGTDGRLRQQFTDLGTLFRLLPTIRQFMVYK